MPKLSVVIPVYQEPNSVRDTVTRLLDVLETSGLEFEVIIVDDGSTDGTRETVENLVETYPARTRLFRHPYNKGNGAAVKTGIRAAQGALIACMDADGQHDPRDLLRMLPHMDEYDLVVGARTRAYRGAWYRGIANRIYNRLASWLTGFPVADLTSGFRVFRAPVVREYLHLLPQRFSYPTTTTLAFYKGGHNVKYVDVDVKPRRGSGSKIDILGDGWRFLLIIFKIIVVFEPLRVFLPVAGTLFLLAALSTAYSIWDLGRLHLPNSAVLLFTVGVLVVLLGLIAEQIAALQVTSRNREQ